MTYYFKPPYRKTCRVFYTDTLLPGLWLHQDLIVASHLSRPAINTPIQFPRSVTVTDISVSTSRKDKLGIYY